MPAHQLLPQPASVLLLHASTVWLIFWAEYHSAPASIQNRLPMGCMTTLSYPPLPLQHVLLRCLHFIQCRRRYIKYGVLPCTPYSTLTWLPLVQSVVWPIRSCISVVTSKIPLIRVGLSPALARLRPSGDATPANKYVAPPILRESNA